MSQGLWYMLYAAIVIGAAGLYCLLPSRRADGRTLRGLGALVGLAALALLAVSWVRVIGPLDERYFFVLFALIAVVAGVRVITHTRPVYSALYFILVMLATVGLCVLATAEFLAIALVIVYGGAILVTYIFVIMLARQEGETQYDLQAREPLAAIAVGFLLLAGVTQAMQMPDPLAADKTACSGCGGKVAVADSKEIMADAPAGTVEAVGAELLTRYVVALELSGVLLLVAMVGAIAISQKRIETRDLTPEELAQRGRKEDLHRAGREARPF